MPDGVTMGTQTGQDSRTLVGHVIGLLEYPRLVIERDVDFTHCHLRGRFTETDQRCTACAFGKACRWLAFEISPEADAAPLPDLIAALSTAADYLQETHVDSHERHCDCDTCTWLRNTRSFLRARPR